MTDRHINFRPYQVRAALEGRLSQTRLVLKGKSGILAARSVLQRGAHWMGIEYDRAWPLSLPYALGDRLCVREAWSGSYTWRDMPPPKRASCGSPLALQTWYWADGNPADGDWERPRPSIHMPRWASRLTLIVTDVRVQRLQEITLGDICAEGLARSIYDFRPVQMGFDAFADLWNSLHGPDAWDANPWVCALTFNVIRANIDSPEAANEQ